MSSGFPFWTRTAGIWPRKDLQPACSHENKRGEEKEMAHDDRRSEIAEKHLGNDDC